MNRAMTHLPERILVKFSGQVLQHSCDEFFSQKAVERLVQTLDSIVQAGIGFGVVIGGGNLFRGIKSREMGLDRVVGDQVGMLATMMNALVVQDALQAKGIRAHIMAPHSPCPSIVRHNPLLAREYIARGEPVLFAGGTGNPFFTTDSGAIVRALEIEATLFVKATKVKGVYSSDPMVDPKARYYEQLTCQEMIASRLNVMDMTAVSLAMEYGLPMFVYKFGEPLSLPNALSSEGEGSYIVPE